MKLLLCLLACLPFLALANHHGEKKETKEAAPYRHVVLFKFKDEVTKEQTAKIEKEFAALQKKIPTITEFEWGTNVSPENHDQGFTHCFVVSFKERKGFNYSSRQTRYYLYA